MLGLRDEKIRLGVLCGGDSSEREISLQTAEDIMNNIDRDKYDVHEIVIDRKAEVRATCEDFDFIFIALHGGFGENGDIQQILSENSIKYTGTDLKGSRICMDKMMTKEILREAGLIVPKGVNYPLYINREIDFVELSKRMFEESLEFPMVLKPVDGGSSIGVSLIHSIEDIKNWQDEGVGNAIKLGTVLGNEDVAYMLEEFIDGIEATISILDNDILSVIQVDYNSEFLDYDRKYRDNTIVIEEMKMSDEMMEEIRRIVDIVVKEVSLKIYGRIDIIIKDKKIYILEINTLPGLRVKSFFPLSAQMAGISYKEMLDKLIMLSRNKA